MFDYFYDFEADQFSFYRVPKVMFTQDIYNDLSTEAKILYGILLDRVSLSTKNGWKDEAKRIYIIFTIEEILTFLHCSNTKAVKLLAELEEKGLIEKKRQGLGKPNVIYVKNFIRQVAVKEEGHFKKCKNDTSGSVEFTSQEVSEVHCNNTDDNNTDISETENSIDPADPMKAMDDYQRYQAWFWSALGLGNLLKIYPEKEVLLQEIQNLLVDTCCSSRKTIRIGRQDMPTEAVKGRLMKLNEEHIRYVLDSLKHNANEVRNIQQYLLTSLYNAPATISSYYQEWGNNGMRTQKERELYAAVNHYGNY